MKNENEIRLLDSDRQKDELKESASYNDDEKKKIKIFAVYITVLVILILIFVLNPGARKLISEKIADLGNLGLAGSLVLVLLGILILCGGFPYTTFEFFLGYCLKDFFRALCIDLISLIIGSTICFFLTKTYLREFVMGRLKRYPHFMKFKLFVEKDPWKNLFLMRFIYMPVAVKQYGLPLFNINYIQFIFTCLPVSTAFGSFRIYLGMATLNLKDTLVDNEDNSSHSVLIVLSMIVTCGILGYFAYFSKKIMSDIEQNNEGLIELQPVGGDSRK